MENNICLTKLQDSIDTIKLDSPDAVLILGDFIDKCKKYSDNISLVN
jgi:predicted MPP superfamily phosphohydrolase